MGYFKERRNMKRWIVAMNMPLVDRIRFKLIRWFWWGVGIAILIWWLQSHRSGG